MRFITLVALTLSTFLPAQEPESRKIDPRPLGEAFTKLLDQLEKDVQDPAKRDAVMTRMAELRTAASELGSEWEGRVAKLAAAGRMAELKEAVDAAKAKEAAGNLQEALAAYDAAVARFLATFDRFGPEKPDEIGKQIALYKELLAFSDGLADRVETPEFEAGVGARDMLSPKERSVWGVSAGAKMTPSDGQIALEGIPIEGRKIVGVTSMLPPKAAPWHDVVIDLEFTLVSGEMEMYVRYWPDRKSYMIRFNPSEGYELNKSYRMTLRIKGSTISLKAPDQPENRDRFSTDTSRTGGLGFGMKEGAKAVITRCDLKVLR